MDLSANFNSFVDGLSTFLIGVSIVFFTLVLLILIIIMMSKVLAAIESRGKKEHFAPAQSKPTEILPEEPQAADELELIAVITAAIAASMGTTSDKLHVRSFRKVERKVR